MLHITKRSIVTICVMVISLKMISSSLMAQSFDQERLNATIGLDFQALDYVGLRYQFSQSQLGIHYGFSQREGDLTTMMLSYHQHLLGSSKLSNRKPWFVRPAVVYAKQKEHDYEILNHLLYASVCVGRDFNFSERFGAALAVGGATTIYAKEVLPVGSVRVGDENDNLYNFLVGMDMNVYYRFVNRKRQAVNSLAYLELYENSQAMI